MLKTASVTCFLLVGFRFVHVNIVAKKRESPYIYLTGKADFEHLPRAHKSVLYIFRTFRREVDNSWQISDNRGVDDKKINLSVFLDSSSQS